MLVVRILEFSVQAEKILHLWGKMLKYMPKKRKESKRNYSVTRLASGYLRVFTDAFSGESSNIIHVTE